MAIREEAVTALVVDARQAQRGAAEFERAMKSVTAANEAAVRATERVETAAASQSRAFTRLRSQLDPTFAAQQRLERGMRTLSVALERGSIDAAEHTRLVGLLEARYRTAGTAVETVGARMAAGAGTSRNFGAAIQQAGFQVGDFAVQVASGQSALRAFIQQGTQMVSMFGPWGAVIGAAGAVVGALAAAFWDVGEATDDAEASLTEYTTALQLANALIEDTERRTRGLASSQRDALREGLVESDREITRIQEEIAAREAEIRERVLAPIVRPRGLDPADLPEETLEALLPRIERRIELDSRLAALQEELRIEEEERARILEGIRILEEQRARTIQETIDELEREHQQLILLRSAHEQGAAAVESATDAIEAQNVIVRLGLDPKNEEAQRIRDLVFANNELERSIQGIIDAERERERAERDRQRQAEREAERMRREQQRAAEEAAREMQRPFDQAARNIQDAFADTWRDIFRDGINSFGDLARRIRDIFINLAAEIAALMTIRPVLAGVGILPGVGGGLAGMPVGGFNLLGLSGIGSSINAFGAGLGFASSTGVSVAAAGPGAVGPHVVGSVPGAAQTGFFGSGATLLGTLGAGGLGFIGGGLLASLTGGNQLGGALGGGLGAGIGFAVGGPVGGILGGLAGSVLGGLLGGGKKSSAQLLTAPDRFADFQSGLFRETPFGFVGFSASGTRKIDEEALRQMLEAVAGFDIAAASTLRENEIRAVARILQETEALREKSREFDARDFQELVDDRIRNIFRALGLGADVAAQATAGVDPAASLERALQILTDRQTILSLGETAEEVNVFAEAMTALENRFAELGRRAVELGLDTDLVVTGFEKAAEALRRELLAPIDAFLASLETSALAPGTPLDRLGAAREQFADIVARARAGDAAAIAALPAAGQQVLTLGRQVFASTTDFAQLFEQVRSAVQSIREAPALTEIDNTAVVEAIREAEQARREEARRAEQQREELRREMSLLRQELRIGGGRGSEGPVPGVSHSGSPGGGRR